MTISLALGSLIAGLIAGGASIYNTYSQKKTNEENRDYADAQTTAQWERDDTSFQRQVADAKSAGLSPLAVTGYAPSSSPVTAMAQAPQMDLSQMLGALGNSAEIGLGEKQLSQQKSEFDQSFALETYKAEESVRQLDEQIQQTAIEHKDQISQFVSTLQYQYDVLNDQIDTHNGDMNALYDSEFQKNMMQASHDSLEMYESLCNSLQISPHVKVYTDFALYQEALNNWKLDFSKLGADSFGSSSSSSSSTSKGGSVGLNILGSGGSLSGSSGASTSGSVSGSQDRTRQNSSKILPSEPYPIFRYKPHTSSRNIDSGSALVPKGDLFD